MIIINRTSENLEVLGQTIIPGATYECYECPLYDRLFVKSANKNGVVAITRMLNQREIDNCGELFAEVEKESQFDFGKITIYSTRNYTSAVAN